MMEGERDGVRSKMEAESNVGEVRWREKHDEGKSAMEGEVQWREKCDQIRERDEGKDHS